MRRKDREITDKSTIEDFISKQQIIRIGLIDNGEVFIVPVNYGYTYSNGAYTFYFHGAKAGRKYELAKLNPSVGFEIDGEYKLMISETACDCSTQYKSVIGNGILSIVNNEEECVKGLNYLMLQLTGKKNYEFSNAMLNSVAVFKLEVRILSCKAKF